MKNKQSISAEVICDSISEDGHRITTFVVIFPRIVLAEFNTHRMFSRNSASSRAIPFKKMLQKVITDPFIPIAWMKDHSGMQGNQFFDGWKVKLLTQFWLTARNLAVILAWLLSKIGLTKQIVNRLLEPFLWHTVLITATDFENFFSLRAEGAAEIHIQDLAHKMLFEYNSSRPKKLKPGEWHIPFGDKMKDSKIWTILQQQFGKRISGPGKEVIGEPVPQQEYALAFWKVKLAIATARAARVSYNDFDGNEDYEKDIKLHDRLAKMGHWSPFEHCAQCMTQDDILNHSDKHYIGNNMFILGYSGNYRGWIQYRKTFKEENRKDNRVIKKK